MIEVKLTRIGPRRTQGWTVFDEDTPVAYYERNPLLFSQMFDVEVTLAGEQAGYHSVRTEDPLSEFTRQNFNIYGWPEEVGIYR